MNYAWHYAPWEGLPRIIAARALIGSDAPAPGAPAMVWFSSRQDREPTAAEMVRDDSGHVRRLGFDEQRSLLGWVRFGLRDDDARLLRWPAACKAAGMGFTDRRKREAAGRQLGANPADWLAVAGPIPLIGLRFQVLLDRWGDADMSEAARMWTRVRAASGAVVARSGE